MRWAAVIVMHHDNQSSIPKPAVQSNHPTWSIDDRQHDRQHDRGTAFHFCVRAAIAIPSALNQNA
jgi:hypothetical protein